MTRKDYELIAGVILVHYTKESSRQAKTVIGDLATSLCDRLYMDSDRFDRAKFMEACGIYPPRNKKTQ